MEEPETPAPEPEPRLEDQARAQHAELQSTLLRRRGVSELWVGGFLAAVTLLIGSFGGWMITLFGIPIIGVFALVAIATAVTGLVHVLTSRQHGIDAAAALVMATHRRRLIRGWIEVSAGVVGIAGGLIITVLTYKHFTKDLSKYAMAFGPFVVGYAMLVIGVLRLLNADVGLVKPANASGKRNDLSIGFGFKTFVAWRYLMARHHRLSRIVLAVFFVATFAASAALLVWFTILRRWNPLGLDLATMKTLGVVMLITIIAGVALVYFSLIIGVLRFLFSFFTTVPIVGVWIGTTALIIVLSVMSGFETDLRQKILGSNAHIQVTAESGDITGWRDIKERIDKVPGVRASTPYAVSEVVIAANNNGMNVIIKGIDPNTVGSVTKLIDSIKDDKEEAMKRLLPMITDDTNLEVLPATHAGSADVVDPPPPEMPESGDPIDYSQPPDEGSASGSADAAGSGAVIEPSPIIQEPAPVLDDTPPAKGSAYGGDAPYLVHEEPLLDPAPAELVTSDAPPTDYSGRAGSGEMPIEVVDVPFDQPMNRRTQSLPGILVGQELVKQTHLYVGQEVRVVSPLSDPSNPDATGTPIPFNKDYRVAGIFFTGMYEYDLKNVYVTLDSLTGFLDRGDVVDGIEIRISNPDETPEYVDRLKQMLGPHYRVQDWRELNQSLFSALEIEKIAMFLVLGIVILVASFSIIGNLIMVVVEKGREIALIKTLGASDSSVMTVFAIQGLLIGIVGTALGVITGLEVCWLLKTFGFPLNPDVYYIDRLPVNVEAASVMLTGLAGVMISMLATFYPAIVAARVRPAAGMRH